MLYRSTEKRLDESNMSVVAISFKRVCDVPCQL